MFREETEPTPSPPDAPRVGDRVKLIGAHRFAGCTGIYITDRSYYDGGDMLPVVRVSDGGREVETLVWDPETQMRKL